jgi:hypothetical protein
MDRFDFEQKQATPEWLTSVLVKNGFLKKGEVYSIRQKAADLRGGTSDFFSLKVLYSQESDGHLPPKIIIKMTKPKFYDVALKEIDFYDIVSSTKTPLPLVTCYGTENSPSTKQGCILLEDLTETHHQPQVPLPPFQDQCKDAVTVLAKMHAYWWNHSCFGEPNFELPSEERLQIFFQLAENGYLKFVDFLGDRLSEKRKNIFETVFEKLPELIRSQLSSPKNYTLCHGDVHDRSFLFPNNRDKDYCVIFDWQFWTIASGARDMASMIAYRWFPEQRQLLEQPLLKIYHEELQKQQIDYKWEELQTDYRVNAIINILGPVIQYSQLNLHPSYWWFGIERSFAAFEDLDCMELL